MKKPIVSYSTYSPPIHLGINPQGHLQIDVTSQPIVIKGPDTMDYPDGDSIEVLVNSKGKLIVNRPWDKVPLDFWSWLNLEENAHFKSCYLEWEKEMEEKNSVRTVGSDGCMDSIPATSSGGWVIGDPLTLGYEETTLHCNSLPPDVK